MEDYKNPFGEEIEKKIEFENIRAIVYKSMIPDNFKQYKWSDYDSSMIENDYISDSEVIKSRINAKKICKAYTNKLIEFYKNLENNPDSGFKKIQSLIIYGAETSGKTVLATLIARTLAEKCQKTIYFVDFMDLNAEMYSILDFRSETFTTMLEKYKTPDILIIDEVAKTKQSPSLEPFISALIRQRQNDDKAKPTIITSKIADDHIGNILGDDAQRFLKKQREFISLEILTERPYILETYKESIYDAKEINNELFKFMNYGKNNKSFIPITESQMRVILNKCYKGTK